MPSSGLFLPVVPRQGRRASGTSDHVDDFEQDAASFDVAGPVDERNRANPHFYFADPLGNSELQSSRVSLTIR
jgi:hypothetical protein